MKIVAVTPMFYPALGGAEWHLYRLCKGLTQRGHDVTVLTSQTVNSWDLWHARPAELPAFEIQEGIRIRRLPGDGGLLNAALENVQRLPGGYRSCSKLFGEHALSLLNRKPFLTGLMAELLKARPDIVISFNWYWPPAYHVHLARKLKRFRLVAIPLFHLAEPWCSEPAFSSMLAACDAGIANTEFEAAFMREHGCSRTEAAGVGVDPENYCVADGGEFRRRHHLGKHPVVGFVGRIAANKGAGTLLRAMKIVWQWNPEVRLVLAGPRPPVDREVNPIWESLTDFDRERIVASGPFEETEKASIFDSFDVFALPSTGESFGIAYLEAWMRYKPVVGARIGPTSCVIHEGVDGLLAAPKDAEETANAIITLLRDPARRETMGRSGHAKTLERYTWDKVIDHSENLLLELVPKSGLRRTSTALVPAR